MFDPLAERDPAKVGPYRLRARIGSGGMGRVYLAYSPGGRALAVKIVRDNLAEDPEFRQRFRREISAAGRVRGLYTAELVDSDPDGDPPWLATAYVPGPSLREAVGEHGPMPTRTSWLLLAGVAEALQSIHAAGIIHRDLKPANVLLAADGPRVIDFGIARTLDATPVTRTGVGVGSPQFMAPEHALGRPLTEAADIFSLGALAVFAATGASPFGEGPDPAVLYRVVNEPPELTGLDPDLRELVALCLDKDPENRPSLARIIRTCRVAGDATSLKIADGWLPTALERQVELRAGELPPPLDQPDTTPVPATEVITAGRRRRPAPVAVAAAVVLAVAVLVVAVLVSRSSGLRGNAQASGGGSSVPATTTTTTTSNAATTTTAAAPAPTTTTAVVARQAPPAAPPAKPKPALLGAPNWDGWCRATGQGGVELRGNDAYSWHCTADNGLGDDGKAVCDWTYGTQTTNRIPDFSNPNSWECWRANGKLGPLDFDQYCRLLGYPSAYYVDGRNAYGWRCTNDPNALDSQDACLRLYGSSPPVSRFQNFYDRNSWECWG